VPQRRRGGLAVRGKTLSASPVELRVMSLRWLATAAAALCAAALPGSEGGSTAPRRDIAWVWDGEDVPAWSAGEAAVVVDHFLLQGEALLHRPRAKAPALPPHARVTPVVHVELSTVRPPSALALHQARLVQAVVDAAARSSSGWVQLDLEARPSYRDDYLRLVAQAHRALGGRAKLSVTALAWWCRAGWTSRIEADELVPMFYRMGRDAERIQAFLHDEPWRFAPRCRSGAAGFARQEPPSDALRRRYARIYWFDLAHGRKAADLSSVSPS
jgi:hypothetical protein